MEKMWRQRNPLGGAESPGGYRPFQRLTRGVPLSPGIYDQPNANDRSHNAKDCKSQLATHGTTRQNVDSLQNPHNPKQNQQDSDNNKNNFHVFPPRTPYSTTSSFPALCFLPRAFPALPAVADMAASRWNPGIAAVSTAAAHYICITAILLEWHT